MKKQTKVRAYGPILLLLIVAIVVVLTGCSSKEAGGGKLSFKQVELVSEPAEPVAKQETKLTVLVHNDKYVKQEAKLQLQINSKENLPQLIDMTREEDHYVVTYAFPSAGDYSVTIHMSYEEDHFAFLKEVKVK